MLCRARRPHGGFPIRTQELLRDKSWQLGERVKELSCLYEISRLKNNRNQTLHDFIKQAVRLIPSGWQYPESACARIIFQDREFVSDNFEASEFCQRAELTVDGEPVGSIELFYRDEKPTYDDGPFLKEERLLLDVLARELSAFIQRKQDDMKLQLATNKLRADQQLLKDKNTALGEVLDQIDNEKRHIMHQVQTNVDKVVMPILRMLSNKVSPSEQQYLTLLSNCLKDVTAPFMSNLGTRSQKLSPRESEVCNMIRNGMSSKEISAALDVSLHTVLKQRQRIRKKLGIANDKTNLASFLQTI